MQTILDLSEARMELRIMDDIKWFTKEIQDNSFEV